MKVKCVVCEIEGEILGEELEDITKLISRQPKINTSDYLRIVSIIR